MPQDKGPEPILVKPEDIEPRHRWDRPLPAPGQMQVDFEEGVDVRRLHRYRLGRTRQALANSGLGALLCFDQHNTRYVSSTVIGEWARDMSAARIEEEVVLTPHGATIITLYPAAELPIANRY